MSILKGKEVRLLKARIDNNEMRLMRLECKHIEGYFKDYRNDKDDPWSGGDIKCKDCGKLIKQYANEVEFLKAKHKVMREIIKSDTARIAELEE